MFHPTSNFDGESYYIYLGIRVLCAFISQDGDFWTSLFPFTLLGRGDCSLFVPKLLLCSRNLYLRQFSWCQLFFTPFGKSTQNNSEEIEFEVLDVRGLWSNSFSAETNVKLAIAYNNSPSRTECVLLGAFQEQ